MSSGPVAGERVPDLTSLSDRFSYPCQPPDTEHRAVALTAGQQPVSCWTRDANGWAWAAWITV